MIPKLKNLPYIDRLKECNMSTLHYRRLREDTIETYKIVCDKYDAKVAPILTQFSLPNWEFNTERGWLLSVY